jgi:methionyl-tRNA synthetase
MEKPPGIAGAMKYGYHCEECEEAIWPATPRGELVWLRNKQHVVREVAQHVQSGLDSWMTEALEFLDRHSGHSVVIVRRP